ncbi:MAG: adenosylcobinamide-GDP ribazoletransferase [Candidatus Cyclobacteriaceae bacterium M3_2C_046]
MIKFIRREIHIFFTAIMFYTRIPCPAWVDHSEELLNKATRYFPLMGWIVGGFSAAIFWLCSQVFPVSLAVLLSMVGSIWLTGAFHEDGFADFCDGFGGGWTKIQILEIMKDSRLGAYGGIGIIMLLIIKFVTLWEMDISLIPRAILAGHSLSRLAAASFIYSHQYVREDGTSKVKPVGKKMSIPELLLALIFGLLPLGLLPNFYWLIIISMLLTVWMMGRYLTRWIGGYTGDCLGATQQLTEVVAYLSILLIYHFIK